LKASSLPGDENQDAITPTESDSQISFDCSAFEYSPMSNIESGSSDVDYMKALDEAYLEKEKVLPRF